MTLKGGIIAIWALKKRHLHNHIAAISKHFCNFVD